MLYGQIEGESVNKPESHNESNVQPENTSSQMAIYENEGRHSEYTFRTIVGEIGPIKIGPIRIILSGSIFPSKQAYFSFKNDFFSISNIMS